MQSLSLLLQHLLCNFYFLEYCIVIKTSKHFSISMSGLMGAPDVNRLNCTLDTAINMFLGMYVAILIVRVESKV